MEYYVAYPVQAEDLVYDTYCDMPLVRLSVQNSLCSEDISLQIKLM